MEGYVELVLKDGGSILVPRLVNPNTTVVYLPAKTPAGKPTLRKFILTPSGAFVESS